jgi:hypothetical protein
MEISVKVEIKPEWPMPPKHMGEQAQRSMVEMKFKKLSYKTEGLIRVSLKKVMEEYEN